MDPEEVVHSEDEEELSDTEALSERGATIMHALSRKWDGIIIIVEFNGKGKPIGQKVRNQLSGWEGALARALIPLSAFQTWKKAPEELLNLLWVGILIRFNIDVKYRKAVLKSIGVRWRTFKNMLTKKFIFPFKDDQDAFTNPPKKYKIRKPDWHAFVKSRLTGEFQERSKLQSARRKMNKYNHRISRLGYAGLEDKLKEELGESFDEDDRANLWLLARQDKNGGYYDDDTREVAEKIDQLKKEEANGKLVTQGSDDVLAKALGTPEHCGRVRAGGKYVTPTTYFNIPKKGSKAHRAEMESRIRKKEDENKALKERVRQLEALGIIQGITTNVPELEKVASNSSKNEGRKRMSSPLGDQLSNGANNKTNYECLNIELEANVRKKCKQTKSSAKSKSDEAISKPKYGKEQAMGLKNKSVAKTKCKVAVVKPTLGNEQAMGSKCDVAIPKPKSGNVTCKLALESKDNVVADASLIEGLGLDEKIHNVTLGEGYVRVHIIRAISATAILPRPILDDDVTTVGGAVGYIVAWPREFVLLCDNAISKPKSGNEQAIRSKDNNKVLEAKKDMPISKSKSGNTKFPMCKLILESKGNVVADASLIEGLGADEMINDVRLGEGFVRVQIIRAIFATAILPRPIFDDDITTVGGAVGYHVAWPRDFVLLENMTDEVECDEFDECTLKEFGVLVGSVMKGNHISQMDTRVFERELQFFIAKDEIMDVCQPKNLLNANCIIAYIRYLFEKYESSQQRFGFCYPADFSRYADKKEMSRFVLNRLQARQRDQVIFLPYNPGNHWVLVMIDVSAKEVYYLDSIGREPNINLKVMVNTGIKTLALGEGKRVEPKWQRVQCPKQPGDFECGYYVMRFMRHFMKNPNQSLKTKLMELANTRTYVSADLIEIRLEFIEYIEKFISA